MCVCCVSCFFRILLFVHCSSMPGWLYIHALDRYTRCHVKIFMLFFHHFHHCICDLFSSSLLLATVQHSMHSAFSKCKFVCLEIMGFTRFHLKHMHLILFCFVCCCCFFIISVCVSVSSIIFYFAHYVQLTVCTMMMHQNTFACTQTLFFTVLFL